jgi:hypothetical protein
MKIIVMVHAEMTPPAETLASMRQYTPEQREEFTRKAEAHMRQLLAKELEQPDPLRVQVIIRDDPKCYCGTCNRDDGYADYSQACLDRNKQGDSQPCARCGISPPVPGYDHCSSCRPGINEIRCIICRGQGCPNCRRREIEDIAPVHTCRHGVHFGKPCERCGT